MYPFRQEEKGSTTLFSYPVYQQLRRDNKVLEDRSLAIQDLGYSNVTVDGSAQAVQLELVSGNFYEQMQVRPALGRAILPSDDGAPGTGAVLIISDGFWQRSFGRSPDVIGKVITVNTIPVTIVGRLTPANSPARRACRVRLNIFMPLSMITLMRAEIGHDGSMLSSTNSSGSR